MECIMQLLMKSYNNNTGFHEYVMMSQYGILLRDIDESFVSPITTSRERNTFNIVTQRENPYPEPSEWMQYMLDALENELDA